MSATLPIVLPPRAPDRPDVVGFGENSLDIVAVTRGAIVERGKQRLEALDTRPGGQIATAMIGCARQDLRARYIGAVGDDAGGRDVEDALVREGVEARLVRRAGVRTRSAVIVVDAASGERAVFEHRDSRLDLAPGEVPFDDALAGRLLLLDATDLRAAIALATDARRRGVPTIVDVDRVQPGVERLLAQIDVVVVPSSFLTAFTGVAAPGAALAAFQADRPATMVVATLGADGALARVGREEVRAPGFAIAAVDTTGAGDAFRAGLAVAWLKYGANASVSAILAHANATAALNCRGAGAQAGLPTASEVYALVTAGHDGQSK